MKEFKVCIQSYYSNNSDYKEYNNYYVKSDSFENAKNYVRKCIENWNKESKGIIYYVYDISIRGNER